MHYYYLIIFSLVLVLVLAFTSSLLTIKQLGLYVLEIIVINAFVTWDVVNIEVF